MISAVWPIFAGLRDRPAPPAAGRRARAPPASPRCPAAYRPPPRVRKSESAGPGQTSASRQLGSSPLKPLAREHALLEGRHPFDRRRVGEVGRFDADVELAGDAGGVLELVQVLDRRQVLRRQRADVGDGLDLGADSPADHGQGQADAEDCASGRRERQGQERLRRAGPVAGLGHASSTAASERPEPAPPARGSICWARALTSQAQGGEAGGQGEEEGDHDADDQQQAEAADHRGRGEQQGEEAGGGGQAGGGDRRAAARWRRPGRPRRPRARRRWPRRSGPGTGSRSRRRGRSGSAGRRSRPSSGSRRRGRAGRRRSPRPPGPAPAAAAAGASGRRASRVSAITASATPKSTSRASFSASGEAVDHGRSAGDDVAAALAGRSRAPACLLRRRPGAASFRRPRLRSARSPGGVRTRSGPASAGSRSGPSGCSGRGRRAAPSACRGRGARSKTTVATNSSLSMLGALVIPYWVATASRYSRSCRRRDVLRPAARSWRVDLHHRLVEEGRRPGEELDRLAVAASSAQGPGSGFAPFGTLPERQPSSRSSRKMFVGEDQPRQVPLDQDDDRFFAEASRTCWVAW